MRHSYPLVTALLCLLLIAACSGEAPEQATPAAPAPAAQSTAAASTEAAADATGIDNRGSEAAAKSGKWWDALPRADWANFKQVKTSHPWFEVYEVLDGVYAIYEPGQFEEVISFLIIGRNQALLFDTGLGMGNIRGVVKELTKKNLVVLNSHTHYDHVGGNHQFEIVLGRNHPFTLDNAKGASNAEVGEFARGDWIWKQHPPTLDANAFRTEPWEFAQWIEEGQFLDLGGVSLEIVYSPGHAPDSIVLVDHKRRLMFTGDTFYLAPLYTHLDGSSFSDYADSAAKLAAYAGDIDYLLTSHNVPLASGDFLLKLDAAFQAILNESAPFQATDEGREYRFEGFSIITTDPPDTGDGIIELL